MTRIANYKLHYILLQSLKLFQLYQDYNFYNGPQMSAIVKEYLQQKHQSQGQCWPKVKNIFLKNLGKMTFQIPTIEWLQKMQVIKFFPGHKLAHQYSITFLGLINFELVIARNSLLFIAVSRLKKSHDNISCSLKLLLNASTLLLKFQNFTSFIIKKSGQDFCHLVQQEPHSLYQHNFFSKQS